MGDDGGSGEGVIVLPCELLLERPLRSRGLEGSTTSPEEQQQRNPPLLPDDFPRCFASAADEKLACRCFSDESVVRHDG